MPRLTSSAYSPDQIRDVSEAVYRLRLKPDYVREMIAKDGDDGQKLRARAAAMDPTTRAYLEVLGLDGPTVPESPVFGLDHAESPINSAVSRRTSCPDKLVGVADASQPEKITIGAGLFD